MSSVHKPQIEVKDIESNVYYKNNPEFFLQLKDMVENHLCHYSRMLKCTRTDILTWINSQLPLLQDSCYTIATKVSWIMHGRTAFPICEVCHKNDKYIGKNIAVTIDYSKSCCGSCNQKHPETVAKIKATNLRVRGTEYAFQAEEVKDKIYDSMAKNHGHRTKEQIEKDREEHEKNKKPINIKKIVVKDIESNVYFKDNPTFFLELKQLVDDQPFSYGYTMTKTHKELLTWINAHLPLLQDPQYQISTKAYWILNNMTTFPICPICGKDDNYKGKNVTLSTGYTEHCSDLCAQRDPKTQQTIRATCKERYGDEFPQRLPDTKQKAINTFMANIGVPNPSQSPIVQAKIIETNMRLRGVPCPFQSPEVQAKIAATNEKNLGAANPFGSKIIQEQIKETHLKNLGVENPSQSEEVKAKKVATCLKNFGVENPMQCSKIRQKAALEYSYNGITFDSAPELAYYIWLTDHNVEFEYQPEVHLAYYYNGHKSYYLLDFKVGNTLVEIKGTHLIDKDGNLKLVNKKGLTEDEIQQVQYALLQKSECMRSNNVKIILDSSDEMKNIFAYISSKYGKDYIRQFKNTSKKV